MIAEGQKNCDWRGVGMRPVEVACCTPGLNLVENTTL
jgi:hypothetical protein